MVYQRLKHLPAKTSQPSTEDEFLGKVFVRSECGFFKCDRAWLLPLGTANATATATEKASSAVVISGTATDPAGLTMVNNSAAKRVANTLSTGQQEAGNAGHA